MMQKIAITMILMMCMLNLLPPVFSETVYNDNVFYSIMYLLLSFLGLTLPYLVRKLNVWWKRISTMIGAWFVSGLISELMNFRVPDIVINSSEDKTVYIKYLTVFIVGISFIITHETWIKQKKSEG